MLSKEFDYYLQHRAELVKKNEGKFLVIKDQRVLGVYDSPSEAVRATTPVHELGTFLVQECSHHLGSIHQKFTTRAHFIDAEKLFF